MNTPSPSPRPAYRCWIYSAVLVLLWGCTPRPLIFGGSDDPSTPVNDAVALVAGGCSGSLIAPTLVLTAAHCLSAPIGGDSDFWSDADPQWYRWELPDPAPNECCTTGVRQDTPGADGPFVVSQEADILGFDIESFRNRAVPVDLGPAFAEAVRRGEDLGTPARVCAWTCAQRPWCEAWTSVRADYRPPLAETECYLKAGGRSVAFGNDRRAPTYRTVASAYSMPGFDDIAVLRMDHPVPRSVARPSFVFIRHPDQGTNSPEFTSFLERQRYAMAGWGGGREVRQAATGTYGSFPLVSFGVLQPNMIGIRYDFGTAPEVGDSGSPVWIEPHPSRVELFSPYYARLLRERYVVPTLSGRVVMGALQHTGGGYVSTFGNSGPTGQDGAGFAKPDISRWLDALLYDELRRLSTPAPPGRPPFGGDAP